MVDFAPGTKRLLANAGWRFLRHAKGDHDIWHDPKSGKKVTVDSKIPSRHTANAILKQAGLEKVF